MCGSPDHRRGSLDTRGIRFTKNELIWLAGNTFYGKTQMFSPDFINWLAVSVCPDYELRKVDGQYELHFHGPWTHTTMWEIPALSILNELRSRQVMKGKGRFELDVLYARAKAKLWSKVEQARQSPSLGFRGAAPPRFPLAALVCGGRRGRASVPPSPAAQRAPRDGQRS